MDRRLGYRATDVLDLEEHDRAYPDPKGSASFLCTVASGGSGAAQRYYLVSRIDLLGVEADGAAGDLRPTQDSFLAFNVGTAVPPVGTQMIVCSVDSRWVFQYDG
jgi:hypothetical protein